MKDLTQTERGKTISFFNELDKCPPSFISSNDKGGGKEASNTILETSS
jgi:hypothetical protein